MLGLGEQPERKKGCSWSECRDANDVPQNVGKAASIRGSQEAFPIGGTPRSGMEKGGEGAEFSHREGALAQLEAGMCSGQSKGFQRSLSQVTGEEPSQVSIRWSGTQRQLLRVDLGVKGKLAGCSFRRAPGHRNYVAGS